MEAQSDVTVNTTTPPSIGSRDKSVGWYDKTFSGVQADARELLESYSHIPADQVNEYALKMVRPDPALHPTLHSICEPICP